MSWVHRCMIVPTEHVELARVLCETLAGPGGALSSTGEIQGSESYMNLHTGAY